METLDDLLIKRRRGALAAADERRLGRALLASREYEVALLAQHVFDRDGEPRAGDAERLRELVDAVVRQLPPAPPAPRAWRAPLRIAIPVLIAGAAAAAFGVRGPTPIEPSQPAPAAAALPAQRESATQSAISIPAPAITQHPSALPPPRPAAPEAHAARREATTRRHAPAPRRSPATDVVSRAAVAPPAVASRAGTPPAVPILDAPSTANDESAQSLFRRANRLRQSDWPAAARLYVELIRSYPTSDEAGVSEVALGKWSLAQGRSGDALEWFRAHQRRAPGALSAEALFGEARALESIGSHHSAREPWRRLLETYPDSPYANVARQRLGLP
jgi:TolA-binding protein